MKICCPFCGWWIRKIDWKNGLYECSNKGCNCIIQKFDEPTKIKEIEEEPQQELVIEEIEE